MQNYNYYIQFQDNKFHKFGIQLLKNEPVISTREIDKEVNYFNDVGDEFKKIARITEEYISSYNQVADDELPANAIIITSEQYAEYLAVLNNQLQDVVLVGNTIKIINKFTKTELKALQITNAQQTLKDQANTMLIQSDRFNVIPYRDKMHAVQQEEFDAWRAELLSVALGESSIMPTTPEFLQKFLEL